MGLGFGFRVCGFRVLGLLFGFRGGGGGGGWVHQGTKGRTLISDRLFGAI